MFRISKLFFMIFIIFSSNASALDNNSYDNNLQIINQNNQIKAKFKVKIATSSKDQKQGLMFVKNLPQNYGMLFDFKEEKIVNMWMKNTFIPLDIIFIDKNNQIVKISHSTKSMSQNIISSISKVNKVLEINAGISKSININIGDKILIKP